MRDGNLRASYNLGTGEKELSLPHTEANNGQWRTAVFHRTLYLAVLMLDNGEGRNRAVHRGDENDNVFMSVTSASEMFGGGIVTNNIVDRDLADSKWKVFFDYLSQYILLRLENNILV